MRKLVIIALVAVGLQLATARDAHASCGWTGRCPVWLSAISYAIAVGMVGTYVGVTGFYAYRDLTDDEQSIKFSGGEAAFNGAISAVMVAGVVKGLRTRDWRGTIAPAVVGAVHTTLAVHGIANVWTQRDHLGHFNLPSDTVPWLVGIAYGTNTLLWTFSDGMSEHGRRYGIAEIATNAPLAAGAGYLAVRELSGGPSPRGVLFGALAAWSGVLVYHGVKTARHPYVSPGLDLLGTDVTPTVVSDGVQDGAGLAMSGRW